VSCVFRAAFNQIPRLISTELYRLAGKEVDINTNYIDIDTDKKDVILFTPDNKTLKLPFIVIEDGYEYINPADRARNSGYPIGQLSNPSQGQKLNLKKLSNEEVERFLME
jgi:hypothetical protein